MNDDFKKTKKIQERIEEALPEFPLIDLDEITAACVKARGTDYEIFLQTMAGMALYVNANLENSYEDIVESAGEQNELNEPAQKNSSNGNRRNFKNNVSIFLLWFFFYLKFMERVSFFLSFS